MFTALHFGVGLFLCLFANVQIVEDMFLRDVKKGVFKILIMYNYIVRCSGAFLAK